ncbi:MAG: 2-oxo acid dehydrogenase subunit E2 [Caldilineaceae bacterium]
MWWESKRIHVGMAVAVDNGLLVPVIRDADERNLVGLAREIAALTTAARVRHARPGCAARGHVHHHQPRHRRQPAGHAHHQPAAGRHLGHRRHCQAAGGAQCEPIPAAQRRRRHRHPAHVLPQLEF